MFFVDSEEAFNFMSDPEIREEYEYIMVVSEMAQFMVKYGKDKVMNDMAACAASLLNPGNYGPEGE